MSATTPLPDELPLPQAVVLKPVVNLQAAAALLGPAWSEQHVLRYIELPPRHPERIDWAWDIAGADAQRQREVRVLASCVPIATRHERKPYETVLREIFCDVLVREHFRRFATVPATFLARRLACSDKHVLALIEDKELVAVERTLGRVGRNSTPAITWDSLKAFLLHRRMTGEN